MSPVRLKKSTINPKDPEQVNLLRVLGSIESARVQFELYEKACEGHDFLKDKQIVILNYALAAVACALETIKEFIESDTFQIDNFKDDAKREIDFLYSYEVTAFQRKFLKRIRNKCAFHFDVKPAQEYLKKLSEEKNEPEPLYEQKFGSKRGSFPLASCVIANWILSADPNTTAPQIMKDVVMSINKLIVFVLKQKKFQNFIETT